MDRLKRNAALAAGSLLVACAITGVAYYAFWRRGTAASQQLADGSWLVVDRVAVGSRVVFTHGTRIEKLLGDLIPPKGVHVLGLNLARRTREHFDSGGQTWLVAQFKLFGPNAANHALGKPAFFRQFRLVVYGQDGIEFVEEFWRDQFRFYPDGYYGYVATSRFPRDSRWLGFRVERRPNSSAGGPWTQVANLRVRNPALAAIQPWVAKPGPITNSVGGLDLVLGNVTVQTIPYMPLDIWNHIVTAPVGVRSNGVALTNWSAPYGNLRAEDASGNWDTLASHRSLDPRFVWKIDADFEPVSGFSPEELATVRLPPPGSTLTTNLMQVPVVVHWDGYYVEVSIPTNQPQLRLQYVAVSDIDGRKAYEPSGSWGQYSFRRGSFMAFEGKTLTSDFKAASLTFAVVPNVHTTFYTQPRLLPAAPGR